MNITKETEKYIQEHPSTKESLKKGLINYSKLSREISKELNLPKKNFDAVLIACRRFWDKLKLEKKFEKPIMDILKKTKLEIKNKIVVVILEKNIYYQHLTDVEKEIKKKNGLFRAIEGANAITLITNEEFLDKIKYLFKHKILKINQNLAEITLKSPQDLETTPGVMGYLYSLFGEHNLNIVETMSCWTDTIFVIRDQDIAKVMQILSF